MYASPARSLRTATTRLEYETRKVCTVLQTQRRQWPIVDCSWHFCLWATRTPWRGLPPYLPPFPCSHTPCVCSARRRLGRLCSLGRRLVLFAPQPLFCLCHMIAAAAPRRRIPTSRHLAVSPPRPTHRPPSPKQRAQSCRPGVR